jgi:glycosyltransferase involved in cell wall biosynthesis
MTKITALIITLNEEKHIGACIDSVKGVVNEVLVVNSFSTDKTKMIAEAQGAKVIEYDFLGFGPQRNLGAGYASNDLILVLDADERLSEELKRTIVSVKANPTAAAYSFNRLSFIGTRPVRSAGWYPDTHVRLYDRRKAKWNERQVHEDVEVNGDVKFLSGDLLHYSYEDMTQVKEKSTRYAKLGSIVYKDTNKLILFFKMTFSPLVKFFKTYFIQLGFTDGYIGLMICYYRSRETFLKYYGALV